MRETGKEMHNVLVEKPEGKEMLDKTSPGGKDTKSYLGEKDGKICGNKMPTRCNRGFYCRSY